LPVRIVFRYLWDIERAPSPVHSHTPQFFLKSPFPRTPKDHRNENVLPAVLDRSRTEK
jgi:hypothetical protein